MSDEGTDFQDLLVQGTRLLREGKATRAVSLLGGAYALEPENVDAALNYGGALIMAGKFRKAIPILETLRDKEPQNAMVWTNLGAAYLGNPVLATDEHQVQAIAAFKQALELNPHAPSVAYNLALIYRDREEYKKAMRWLERAIKSNPGDSHARSLLNRLREGDSSL